MPTSLKERKQQHPIRTGCYVEFVNIYPNGYQTICKGDVTQDTYDAEGHHTFTIQSRIGPKSAVVSGAKLYSNLLHHVPGKASQIARRRALKRGRKARKQRERRLKRRRKKH